MEMHNDDEIVPPVWLNFTFFNHLLHNVIKIENSLNFKLHSFEIQPASKKGDHYASLMFRVKIVYHNYTTHENALATVIVKTLPAPETEKGRNLSETPFFTNEYNMYTEVIPKMQAVWRLYGESVKFAGRLLYAAHKPHPVIVLEDLCLSGYDILRERLFNRNELKACLSKLAKWHAVSYKMAHEPTQREKKQSCAVAYGDTAASTITVSDKEDSSICGRAGDSDGFVTQMRCGLFKARSLIQSPYISESMQNMISAMEEAGDNDVNKYLPKLRILAKKLINDCIEMNDAAANGIEGSIYVLNHGDFHTKNIMIHKDVSGEMDDMVFVDFQASFYGPLTYDLDYASFTLFSKEIRDESRGELLQYYFSEFRMCLKKLEVASVLPTYKQLMKDCKRWSCFELFLIAVFLPLTKLNEEKPHEVDINLVFQSAEYRQTFYRNTDYLNYVKKLLPRYLEAGYLD